MECIQHFSHEHPLSLLEEDDQEDPKPYLCRICGIPILSSPAYSCSIDANCNFFLHKPCAELPPQFPYPNHIDILILQPPDAGESHKNFTYKCRNYSNCKFGLHPLIAKPIAIESKHKSHVSHPLVVFCKQVSSNCDSCGEKQNGFFFYCRECNFWIHQDCAALPSVMKLPDHHPHPYILSYSYLYTEGQKCSICNGVWNLQSIGMYFCGECSSVAHLTCAKSRMDNFGMGKRSSPYYPVSKSINTR